MVYLPGISFETKSRDVIKRGLMVWAQAMQDTASSPTFSSDRSGHSSRFSRSFAGNSASGISPQLSCDQQSKLPWILGPMVNGLVRINPNV